MFPNSKYYHLTANHRASQWKHARVHKIIKYTLPQSTDAVQAFEKCHKQIHSYTEGL